MKVITSYWIASVTMTATACIIGIALAITTKLRRNGVKAKTDKRDNIKKPEEANSQLEEDIKSLKRKQDTQNGKGNYWT